MTVTYSHSSLCAKRVIRQSPALIDFTVGLVDPVPLLAKWASGFFGGNSLFQKILITEVQLLLLKKTNLKLINHASRNILGRHTETDFRVSTS